MGAVSLPVASLETNDTAKIAMDARPVGPVAANVSPARESLCENWRNQTFVREPGRPQIPRLR